MKCVYNHCVQRCDLFAPIQSATNLQPIDINLSIDCYWQSIPIDNHTNLRHRLVIDYQYQSINWYQLVLIDIDYHRLSISSIGYPGFKTIFYHFICHLNLINKVVGPRIWSNKNLFKAYLARFCNFFRMFCRVDLSFVRSIFLWKKNVNSFSCHTKDTLWPVWHHRW